MRVVHIIKRYLIGVLLLVIVFVTVRYAMAKYRRPGSSTVLEAQSMDMATMTAPIGTVPVATETVREAEFAPTVTYTGSVVAYNDEDVFPRVTGTLVALDVYPGSRVRKGQVLGRLDSVELTSRTHEAAYARQAAQNEIAVSEQEHRQALAQRCSAVAKVASLQSMLRDVQSQLTSAEAMREQSEREREAAQSSQADAEANVTAMQADVEYWNSEIAREEKLYKTRAVSTDEYQRELSQAKTSGAKATQAQAGVREKQAMVAASKAKIGQALAAVTGANARLDQVRSDIRGAQADAAANAAVVDASRQRIGERSAMAGQAAAQEHTAGIMRDYTELKAHQDGIVTERLVSPGTLVQPGMVILRIKNIDRVRLQANVAEVDLSGIHIGNPITVTTQRDPKFHLQTRVTSIFNAANLQSRTVIVEALIPNPGGRLLPGTYIVMQIATSLPRHALTIRQSAVRRGVDQKPYVWVAETEGQSDKLIARRVSVTLGPTNGQRVLVETGLNPGYRVIYAGHEDLNEGDRVTPTEWTAQGPKTLPAGSGQMGSMPGMDMSSGNSMQGKNTGGSDTMPGMKMDNNTGHPAAGSASKMSDMPGMDHSHMPGMDGK